MIVIPIYIIKSKIMKNSSTKIIGALFAIVGIICMCYPIITSLWIEIIVGAGLVVGAMFALVEIPSEEGFWDKVYYLCLALLYAVGGIFMFINPIAGTAAIMVALGVVFLLEGILILVYWSKIQKNRRGLLLLNGVVTLILGLLILTNINDGLWFIGTLVGIDLIFTGITMLVSSSVTLPFCASCSDTDVSVKDAEKK